MKTLCRRLFLIVLCICCSQYALAQDNKGKPGGRNPLPIITPPNASERAVLAVKQALRLGENKEILAVTQEFEENGEKAKLDLASSVLLGGQGKNPSVDSIYLVTVPYQSEADKPTVSALAAIVETSQLGGPGKVTRVFDAEELIPSEEESK